MLGCALPIRCGTTPAIVYAEPWLTSAAEQRRQQVDLDQLALAGRVAGGASAARIPTVANSPASTSTSATPTFCGSPSGAPVMLISPPSAWTSRS